MSPIFMRQFFRPVETRSFQHVRTIVTLEMWELGKGYFFSSQNESVLPPESAVSYVWYLVTSKIAYPLG